MKMSEATPSPEIEDDERSQARQACYNSVARVRCEDSLLFFTRFFFKARQNAKFRVNWHHEWIADELEKVESGETENLIINVSPGSSKTEIAVVNWIARGLALNPRARFLHLSYSDDLASLNSQTARDLVTSDEFQAFWPLRIVEDSKSKKRWNIEVNGKPAGGVYATSLGGQITGFRAGHMVDGFQGAIIIDDPLKPEDSFSRSKVELANRKLVTTVKSRRANPKTPIVIIMQRIAQSDPVGFITSGNLQGNWRHIKIPALMDDAYVYEHVPPKYWLAIEKSEHDEAKRFSYWPYKEPLKDLLAMERGEGSDSAGSRVSRHVFTSQYQQAPTAMGGNLFKGRDFFAYTIPPKITHRKIFADTAQKTAERNDYTAFGCYGLGVDGKLYVLDVLRGKWEAPELKRRAIEFWAKHKNYDQDKFGALRKLYVEDKSSGTGLVQEIRFAGAIPVEGIQRNKDKLTRAMDAQPFVESGMVGVPADAPWVLDFIAEAEAFTSDDSHDFDDQLDTLFDATSDMLASNNKIARWAKLAE